MIKILEDVSESFLYWIGDTVNKGKHSIKESWFPYRPNRQGTRLFHWISERLEVDDDIGTFLDDIADVPV